MAGKSDGKFDGQLAVVTGGAQGIGFAVANRVIRGGGSVSLWDYDGDALDAATSALDAGDRVDTRLLDVTDEAAIAAATAALTKRHGGIDMLFANAGITGPNLKVWEYPLEDWRKTVDIDLTGIFVCNKAIVKGMIARNYGRIVNTASIAGKEGNPNASAYSAAKAGVIALTKSLGKELAEYDIAVNCITPAAARTRIFDQMSEEHIAYMLAKIPRGRFVTVEEIASLVEWMLSAENSFTTGAVFDLSGGRATY